MNIKKRLKAQLAEEFQNLRWLMLGASIFFLGMGLIYFSEYYLAGSLQKELTALIGIGLLGAGGFIAGTAYLFLLINRLGIFPHDN